jgi:predicted homoserine dehydrogenase-like protein
LQLANEEGVVYTSCDGSRQAVIKKLVDDLDLWGLDLVMAGCMEMPVDRYIHPGRIISGPDRSPNYGYIAGMDGTKLNMELSVLANGINGSVTTSRLHGMQIPKLQDILLHYDFDAVWSNKLPIVDYLEGGEPEGSVFAVGYTDNKMQQEQLANLQQLGSGPYYVFHRPQSLGFIEAMECVMEAYFNGTARLQPQYGMKTNVFAYAKKYLEKGEVLDGPGGYKCYGQIENLEEKHFPGLPICLADGLKLKSSIPPDQRITLEDVDYDPDDLEFSLYFRSLQANPQKPIPPRKRVVEENLQYIIPVTW